MAIKEEEMLGVFRRKIFRRIFGPTGDEKW
jgi:hypothetical protein